MEVTSLGGSRGHPGGRRRREGVQTGSRGGRSVRQGAEAASKHSVGEGVGGQGRQ